MLVEREATHRAIALAELADVPVLIVHVSGREAVAQIREAQGLGLKVYAETCPQYLFLTEDDLGGEGFEGAKCICSPPPRDKANQQVIWNALENGTFQVLSSDHAPFSMGPQGKAVAGTDAPFTQVPNGIPGLETRLPLLMTHGVLAGRIDIHTFVALTATNPARLYGLSPRKGTIAVGADADLVVWDTDLDTVVRNDRPAPCGGLHAVRGPAAQGLATADAEPRLGGLARRAIPRPSRSRPVPALRAPRSRPPCAGVATAAAMDAMTRAVAMVGARRPRPRWASARSVRERSPVPRWRACMP